MGSSVPGPSSRYTFEATSVRLARRTVSILGATMLRSGITRTLSNFLFLLIVALATPVAAASGDVVVKLSQAKITIDEDGNESSGSADLSLPGDLIEYKAVY